MTRIAAFLAWGEMAAASFKAHASQDLAAYGPGPYSLDRAIAGERRGAHASAAKLR